MTSRPSTGKRIVLTAVGSLGDVYPYFAIAHGLQQRGHSVIMATSDYHRGRAEAVGLEFRTLRPDSNTLDDPEVMRYYMDPRWGTMRAIRDWFLPPIRESYEDALAASEGADLLVSHSMMLATRLVAEKQEIRWVSTALSPISFFSPNAPPLLPGAIGFSKRLRVLGPRFWGPFGQVIRRATRHWAKPWFQLRKELGLPPAPDVNPITDSVSPSLHLALFSSHLATPQPGWPEATVVTGFPFHDRDGDGKLPTDLARFLDDGPPPIVFTPSSSMASIAKSFLEESIQAARRLGCRAILVLGSGRTRPDSLPPNVAAFDYAPFSALFPRAAAIVHAGGIGTTALAMRSGRPMLVVPQAHDQPDNADRVTSLGIARTIPFTKYTAQRATAELAKLLDDSEYARRAGEIGAKIQQESGVSAACDAIERLFDAR